MVERQDIDWILEKIDALLAHFDIEEPRKRRARQIVEWLTEEYHEQGLSEKEIAQKLSRQCQANLLFPAADSEVWEWHRSKLDELSGESTKELS